MNKTMIRIIAAFLAILMLTACFVACDNGAGNSDDTKAPTGETEAPAGDAETEAPELSEEDILGFEIPQERDFSRRSQQQPHRRQRSQRISSS